MRKVLSLMIADLKIWIRQPKLLIMTVAPLLIISVFGGFFLAKAEVLPLAIVLEDNDPAAIRLENYLINLKSGSGVTWFDVVKNENLTAQEQFEKGKVLGLITIPANLTDRINSEETVKIPIKINNINDDVTKNFIQRMQNAFNHFNDDLVVDDSVYNMIRADFKGNTYPDLPLIKYICVSILGLAMLMSISLAITFSIAREFEDRTMRELVMAPNLVNILAGKLLSALAQSILVVAFILLEQWIIFGYFPQNMLMQVGFFFWGAFFSIGLSIIIATKIKQILPAGILIMVINIASWWVSGGLAPAEAWTGLLRIIADYWPGTYFYQVYINASLLGKESSNLFLRNLTITGIFGTVMILIAFTIFAREVREV